MDLVAVLDDVGMLAAVCDLRDVSKHGSRR
jgi:hypothetical protein